jgi:hypothetical protein
MKILNKFNCDIIQSWSFIINTGSNTKTIRLYYVFWVEMIMTANCPILAIVRREMYKNFPGKFFHGSPYGWKRSIFI